MENNLIPRPEHPRPDFERNDWLNLNGAWEFDFDDLNRGEAERWYETKELTKRITVPFCYQSEMSGVNDQSLHEIMWYRRSFRVPDSFKGKRVFLNCGAVDYSAKVWINGELAGAHQGGHVSFKMEITRFLASDWNSIVIRAEDAYQCDQPRGKQDWREKPDRCWYTATSGIWQTVWLEATGAVYLDQIRLTPDIDRRRLEAEIYLASYQEGLEVSLCSTYREMPVHSVKVSASAKVVTVILEIKEVDPVDEMHYWTPEHPNLYDLEILLYRHGELTDRVRSYFGMRKIAVNGDRILLNNKPYYQKLVLDQGYWPESLMTPPSDAAIRYDIEMTKKFGFNGARKHQKIEDPRYYYWADRLGLLVWGEMPSGYEFNAVELENLCREWFEFIKRDYNHPSIVVWVPFNESWGVRNILVDGRQQALARATYHLLKAWDGTRLVSANDGWEQVESDICGIHDYEASGEAFAVKYARRDDLMRQGATGRLIYAQGFHYQGQPVLITEYGGISFASDVPENWGYHGAVRDEADFMERYAGITGAIKQTAYICGYCYTQLTDVMQETNGLMDAQRRPKLAVDDVRRVNQG